MDFELAVILNPEANQLHIVVGTRHHHAVVAVLALHELHIGNEVDLHLVEGIHLVLILHDVTTRLTPCPVVDLDLARRQQHRTQQCKKYALLHNFVNHFYLFDVLQKQKVAANAVFFRISIHRSQPL